MNQWAVLEKEDYQAFKIITHPRATLEHHAPNMQAQIFTENTKHSEENHMQTPGLTSVSSYRPDHLSLADPVKEWLDHPRRRPFASSCGLDQALVLPQWKPGIG